MKPVITRTMTAIPGSTDYLVTIKIQTNDATGFGRYSESLPDTARILESSINSATANTKMEGKMIQFTWTSLPVNREEILSYQIRYSSPPSSSQLNYTGIFGYTAQGRACTVKTIIYTTPKKTVRLIQH
ncbi:MAG: hypothetical protein ACHQRM_02330 [Bacteroidia bacterium]